MNRYEAIRELRGWRSAAIFDGDKAQSMKETNPALAEALGMAIDALQEPRESYIANVDLPEEELERIFRKVLHEPPQVLPLERKMGRWIRRHSKMWECSECERGCRWRENYCPDCGAKMEVDE